MSGGECDDSGADVVAEPRFDSVCGVELEHGLHLVGGQTVEVGYAGVGKVDDGFDERTACDPLINRASVGANVVREPHEDLLDRASGKIF